MLSIKNNLKPNYIPAFIIVYVGYLSSFYIMMAKVYTTCMHLRMDTYVSRYYSLKIYRIYEVLYIGSLPLARTEYPALSQCLVVNESVCCKYLTGTQGGGAGGDGGGSWPALAVTFTSTYSINNKVKGHSGGGDGGGG